MNSIIKKISACFLMVFMIAGILNTGESIHEVKAAETFKIHFIDVGCADAALLQYGEGSSAKYALIDSGAVSYHNSSDETIDQTKTPAYEYLKNMGVTHLQFVIITHPHQDHIGGMAKILSDEDILIDTIYGNDLNVEYLKSEDQTSETASWTEFDTNTYKKFKQALEERNEKAENFWNRKLKVDYVVPTAGDEISFGDAKIQFFGILDNDYQYGRKVNLNTRQENKYSIVTKITYGSNTFLMTGDAQQETIEKIVKKGYDLTAQVLKEPHHGYQDVTEENKKIPGYTSDHKYLIDLSGANIAVISNGYKNKGKVPYSSVLKDLSKLNVYETSDRGTIIITSDGSQLSIQTEKGDNAPSVVGKLSEDAKSLPLMQSISVSSNGKNKLTPMETDATDTDLGYEKKDIKLTISGTARSFTKLSSIEYKFVKKGESAQAVSYKKGTSLTLKEGSSGRLYIRYNTPLGSKEVKLPGFTVASKAPYNVKIKANRSGIKTLSTSKKNTYTKALKKSVKFTFSATYGVSGKAKTQYKIVPKGKSSSKYKWKTANSVTYKTKNKKVRVYVRFIDKAGNTTTKKTNGFYIKK